MEPTQKDGADDRTVPLTREETAGDPLLGTVLDGRFLLRMLLGRGGMGRVYLAEDQRLKRRVALKLMDLGLAKDSEFAQRFKREAILQAQAGHPGIVQVLDAGESAVGSYIVLEYSEGRSLATLLKLGAMRRDRALDLIEQLLEVLDFAHRQGIVHRDLKPGNILVEERGGREIVRVLDFGIAKLLQTEAQDEGATLTRPGFGFGTPGYMSLEQATGKPTDHRTDLYAAGVILYQLLGGELPIKSTSASDYLVQLASMEIAPLSERRPDLGVPPELDAILLHALARRPDDRMPSALQFLQDLKEFRRGDDAPSGRTGPTGRRLPPTVAVAAKRRGRGPMLNVAGFAILLAVCAWLVVRERGAAGELVKLRAAAGDGAEAAAAKVERDAALAALKDAGVTAPRLEAAVAELVAREGRASAAATEAERKRGVAVEEREAVVRERDAALRRAETAEAATKEADAARARAEAEATRLRNEAGAPDVVAAGLRSDLQAVRGERDTLKTERDKKDAELRAALEAQTRLMQEKAALETELAAEKAKPAGGADDGERERLRRRIEELDRDLLAARAATPAGGSVRLKVRIENASGVAVDVMSLAAVIGAGGGERTTDLVLPSDRRVMGGRSLTATLDLAGPLLRVEGRIARFVRAGSPVPGPPESFKKTEFALKDGEVVVTIK